ncbi:PIN domain-containing protein [Microgenomates group bacterium]|nr:PIN domain-containing protein [Microgenomates group bacterium]
MSYIDLIRICRKKGVLLDANTLLAYLVGCENPLNITNHKRIDGYFGKDYDMIAKILSESSSLIITPYILAEVSNLIPLDKRAKRGRDHTNNQYFDKSVDFLGSGMKESWKRVADLIRDRNVLSRLGIADTSIVEVALSKGCAVITEDGDLCRELLARECHVCKFSILRAERVNFAY